MPLHLTSRSQTSLHQHLEHLDCRLSKTSQHQLTREEQVALVRNLRQSVILDAADEAIYKIGRRSSRHLSPLEGYRSALLSTRPSMETQASRMISPRPPQEREGLDAFYDSVRWLDEDEHLDLTLQLDDYQEDLKEHLPLPSKETRPSFRRHLSISKTLGRSSISMSRPGTHGGISTPASPSPTTTVHPSHVRRKSRALSLINTTRHASQSSTASIDPAAAHYQDPEARAKLRVYLASPQKFDEAVEFGFPSTDATPVRTNQDALGTRGHSRQVLSQDSSGFRTFFSDDRSSTYSDDVSLPDPESPRTPHSPGKATVQPDALTGGDATPLRNISDNYAQLPAASREMTLRMTLTRPDLRACENQIYGWQKVPAQATHKPAQSGSSAEDLQPPKAMMADGSKPKQSLEAFFAGLDEEEETAAESGGFKRFWNKVRRN